MTKHGFSETHFENHPDGSFTSHHIHREGPHKDVKHAVADIDGLHDCLQCHLKPEGLEGDLRNQGIDPEELEEKIHPGLHEEVAKMAQEK